MILYQNMYKHNNKMKKKKQLGVILAKKKIMIIDKRVR